MKFRVMYTNMCWQARGQGMVVFKLKGWTYEDLESCTPICAGKPGAGDGSLQTKRMDV